MLVYAVCPFAVRYTNDGCVKTIQRMPPFTERPHVFIYRRIYCPAFGRCARC